MPMFASLTACVDPPPVKILFDVCVIDESEPSVSFSSIVDEFPFPWVHLDHSTK
jgi:hypothetical protein